MKPMNKTYLLDDSGNKFFGEGPYCLLLAIEETGSLREAAASMGMAYTKALKLINQAEKALSVRLTTRNIGGKNGGGSRLTDEAKDFLEKYKGYKSRTGKACLKAFHDVFADGKGKTACVIMASGEGKRFGGNKLLADFNGKPMFTYVLEATKDVFDERIVVTKHEAIAKYCREHGIDVILHNLPFLSDTIKVGVDSLSEDVTSCVFCPSDQPCLTRDTVIRLAKLAGTEDGLIWRVSDGDRMGSPVAFTRKYFYELVNLPEDKGGNSIIKKNLNMVRLMYVEDGRELFDVDTLEELDVLQKGRV